tara:strand:- start:35 stop:673 length:639 start_codon:yes stop_codon:yes gene_type:complete
MNYNLNLFDELHQIQNNPINNKVDIHPKTSIPLDCWRNQLIDSIALIDKEDYLAIGKICMSYMKVQMKKKYITPASLFLSPYPTGLQPTEIRIHQDKTWEELWDVLEDDDKSIFRIYDKLSDSKIWRRRSFEDKKSFRTELIEKFPILKFKYINHGLWEEETKFENIFSKFQHLERTKKEILLLEEEVKDIDLKDIRNHFDNLVTETSGGKN